MSRFDPLGAVDSSGMRQHAMGNALRSYTARILLRRCPSCIQLESPVVLASVSGNIDVGQNSPASVLARGVPSRYKWARYEGIMLTMDDVQWGSAHLLCFIWSETSHYDNPPSVPNHTKGTSSSRHSGQI